MLSLGVAISLNFKVGVEFKVGGERLSPPAIYHEIDLDKLVIGTGHGAPIPLIDSLWAKDALHRLIDRREIGSHLISNTIGKASTFEDFRGVVAHGDIFDDRFAFEFCLNKFFEVVDFRQQIVFEMINQLSSELFSVIELLAQRLFGNRSLRHRESPENTTRMGLLPRGSKIRPVDKANGQGVGDFPLKNQENRQQSCTESASRRISG
jgi:hypothetical protein